MNIYKTVMPAYTMLAYYVDGDPEVLNIIQSSERNFKVMKGKSCIWTARTYSGAERWAAYHLAEKHDYNAFVNDDVFLCLSASSFFENK